MRITASKSPRNNRQINQATPRGWKMRATESNKSPRRRSSLIIESFLFYGQHHRFFLTQCVFGVYCILSVCVRLNRVWCKQNKPPNFIKRISGSEPESENVFSNAWRLAGRSVYTSEWGDGSVWLWCRWGFLFVCVKKNRFKAPHLVLDGFNVPSLPAGQFSGWLIALFSIARDLDQRDFHD